MSIPLGTKVLILSERNPYSDKYDRSKRRGHHIPHYLKDGSIGEVVSHSMISPDSYRVRGEVPSSMYPNPQTLHKGQFKIIKEEQS